MDPVKWRADLVDSVIILSKPAGDQIEFIEAMGIPGQIVDELALEFDRALETALSNEVVSNDRAMGLLEDLLAQLTRMSGAANVLLWTYEALKSAEEWAAVRRLAARALAALEAEEAGSRA